MTGQNQSSAALNPEPEWVDLGGNLYQLGPPTELQKATWVRKWMLWNTLDYKFPKTFATAGGSRLVATLCFAGPGYYAIIQSTIPRGPWRDFMATHGRTVAPIWYDAAHSNPDSKAALNPALHAEDSVEFICERQMGGFNSGIYEQPRIIVYGKKAGSSGIRQTPLCFSSTSKNPYCVLVAQRLGIQFIKVDADKVDKSEREAMQPGSLSYTTTMEELAARKPKSTTMEDLAASKGKSTSMEKYNASQGNSTTGEQSRAGQPGESGGGAGGGSTHSRGGDRSAPAPGKQVDGFSSLAKGMSDLRLGGGGGNTFRQSNSRHVIDTPPSQRRQHTSPQAKLPAGPAISQTRPAASSQTTLSTQTSASRFMPSTTKTPPDGRGPTRRDGKGA
ncbi:hypothetical protein N658DRAFT_562657 [Parathielavia hyrcaniae]|uniref:Uncharacterized protein n=1 Tax=Parathielavia hyrcaniae TaxID=113614 RepID=A0AAN6SX60_9PEZI|nr:hypothetical protein N658DRAFT_562657 [Parathielavia hyrcaniae]